MAYQLTGTHAHTLTRRRFAARGQPASQTRFQENECEEAWRPPEAIDGIETLDVAPEPLMVETTPAPSRWRWVITFFIIAVLLVVFSLIVYWGLVQSVWWY